MLVYGLISPHPPIIIPAIGGADTAKVRATIQALEHAAADLGAAKPERLIIIAPHEGHGFEVPLYYLGPQVAPEVEVEQILVTDPSYEFYYEYGRRMATELAADPRRTAIVASGDLSHVLKADGPYGFNAAGPVLDELIVKAVRARDAQALLAIDPATLENGAECGLRSILFLFGALDAQSSADNATHAPTPAIRTDVLSYEGPFGVGYLVATFEPQATGPQASPSAPSQTTAEAVTTLARTALEHFLEAGKPLKVLPNLPLELPAHAGAFVSLHDRGGALRGCIGTIAPTKPSLATEIAANAVAAAIEDPRFSPVTVTELPELSLSVDVLSSPQPEPDPANLDPQRYGLIVSTADGRQGVLLPDLEGVNTAEEQIAICRQKAEIGPREPITMQKFTVTRYS